MSHTLDVDTVIPELKTAMREVERTFGALQKVRAKFNRSRREDSKEEARRAMVKAEAAYRAASDQRDKLVELRNARLTQRGDERGELWSRPDGVAGRVFVGGADLGPAVKYADGRIEAGPHVACEHGTVGCTGKGEKHRCNSLVATGRRRDGLDENNDAQMLAQAQHIAKGGWGEASVLARAYLKRAGGYDPKLGPKHPDNRDATLPPDEDECLTCIGAGKIRDGETDELRRCLDCGGSGKTDNTLGNEVTIIRRFARSETHPYVVEVTYKRDRQVHRFGDYYQADAFTDGALAACKLAGISTAVRK